MKKLFFCYLLVIFNFTCLYAGWPINRTPKIEGMITDVTTGKPIENVVLSCVWWEDYVIGGPGGHGSNDFDIKVIVTDKEGKYTIPSRVCVFHPLAVFGDVKIQVLHPLYESKQYYVGKLRIKQDKDKATVRIFGTGKEELVEKLFASLNEYILSNRGYSFDRIDSILETNFECGIEKGGVIHYDIKLLPLEEKWKKVEIDSQKDVDKRDFQIHQFGREFFDQRYFWAIMKSSIKREDLNKMFDKIFVEGERLVEITARTEEERGYLMNTIKFTKNQLKEGKYEK